MTPIKGWFVMSKPIKKSYVDVSITREFLEQMDGGVGMRKYGRFKEWLHFADLNSWQHQKWQRVLFQLRLKRAALPCNQDEIGAMSEQILGVR